MLKSSVRLTGFGAYEKFHSELETPSKYIKHDPKTMTKPIPNLIKNHDLHRYTTTMPKGQTKWKRKKDPKIKLNKK
jgi:hypothetical protein